MAMVATAPLRAPVWEEEDQQVVIFGVPWLTYVIVNDAIEKGNVKVSYLRGALEIMTKGPRHETGKKFLARLLEMWSIEADVPIQGHGEKTLRNKLKEAGLEPDECYIIGPPRGGDPIPDLAIEVVVSHKALKKLPIYEALGVREVWIWENDALTVNVLGRTGYRPAKKSALLPTLDLGLLARHAVMTDQHAAVKAFRDALRAKQAKRQRRTR